MWREIKSPDLEILAERILQKVDKNTDTGCWVFKGLLNANGYGRVNYLGQMYMVHRVIYQYFNGEIPVSLVIDHVCRNRACVNPSPEHLEPVTSKENILRGIGPAAQNAKKTECSKGHPLIPENIIYKKDGERRCKTCNQNSYNQRSKELNLDVPNVLKTQCPKGHTYSPKNTKLYQTGKPWRRCIICHNEQARAYKAKKRGLNANN